MAKRFPKKKPVSKRHLITVFAIKVVCLFFVPFAYTIIVGLIFDKALGIATKALPYLLIGLIVFTLAALVCLIFEIKYLTNRLKNKKQPDHKETT